MEMNIAHEKEHWQSSMSSRGISNIGETPDFSGWQHRRMLPSRIRWQKFSPDDMMINTLTSDPAVALELGRRMAANTKRQPRLRHRLGAAWNRLFTERVPVVEPLRTRD